MHQRQAVHTIKNTSLELHHTGAVHVLNHQALVIADLHIGKAGHFRKNGIPIPRLTNKNNFWKLVEAIEWSKPRKLIFLGDIGHSHKNEEWAEFVDFLDQYPSLKRILIRGNHDILHEVDYAQSHFEVVNELVIGDILWTHEPQENQEYYTIAGHVHPAVRLTGEAKQSLRLPAFIFSDHAALLPAFGEFTGTALIRPKKNDTVWGIVKNKLVLLNG